LASLEQEWSDLPAPFKYLGVKVNPDHVTKHGLVWQFLSDWRTAIPTAMLFSMPCVGRVAPAPLRRSS